MANQCWSCSLESHCKRCDCCRPAGQKIASGGGGGSHKEIRPACLDMVIIFVGSVSAASYGLYLGLEALLG